MVSDKRQMKSKSRDPCAGGCEKQSRHALGLKSSCVARDVHRWGVVGKQGKRKQ